MKYSIRTSRGVKVIHAYCVEPGSRYLFISVRTSSVFDLPIFYIERRISQAENTHPPTHPLKVLMIAVVEVVVAVVVVVVVVINE